MNADLVAAAAVLQGSWLRAVALATGGELLDFDGVACVHQPPPHGELLIPFPRRVGAEALERVLARAREAGVGRIGCWASGADDDTSLAAALADHGFREGWRPHWMARALPAAIAMSDEAQIEAVTAVPEYDAYGQALLAMTRSEEPASHHFVARVGGEFAGMAWLHVSDAVPRVGGIFDVFVAPARRRLGLGRALTAGACARAAAIGCTDVVLNATGEGERLYRALGFESTGFGRTWWLDLPA